MVYPAAGNCERPVYREMTYRRSLDIAGTVPDTSYRTTLEMDVRCRRCGQCLRARAAKWGQSAEPRSGGGVDFDDSPMAPLCGSSAQTRVASATTHFHLKCCAKCVVRDFPGNVEGSTVGHLTIDRALAVPSGRINHLAGGQGATTREGAGRNRRQSRYVVELLGHETGAFGVTCAKIIKYAPADAFGGPSGPPLC